MTDPQHVGFEEVGEELGRLAARLRREAGWDVEEPARRSSLSATEVERIERGDAREVPIPVVDWIAEAVGVGREPFFSLAKWVPPATTEGTGEWILLRRADDV